MNTNVQTLPGAATARPMQAARQRPRQRPRKRFLTPGRLGLYAFLISAALFFLLPLYIMVVTSLKPMSEIRLGNLFSLPMAPRQLRPAPALGERVSPPRHRADQHESDLRQSNQRRSNYVRSA